jgi:hypothetical protein
MISNKHKLSLILSMLLLSCSFFNDSKDIENSPVGTWEVTTWQYFDNSRCSGVPDIIINLDSLEQISLFGLDELQLELTITQDAYMIAILTGSEVDNFERGEIISTGIITYPSDQFCVIWDRGNGDEFWLDGGGDGCEACRDYTINGEEFEMTAYNCAFPDSPGNVPCLKYTLLKQ